MKDYCLGKRIMTAAAAAALVAVLLWTGGLKAKAEDMVPMYRLYYPNTHEHFYTSNAYEKDVLTVQRGWEYEGIGWYAPQTGRPVYRLYNPFTTDHHYTMDENEYRTLGSQGWQQEGVGWYSDPAERVPVYRQFSKHLTTGTHNYTTDLNERNTLVGGGAWDDEGTGWYAVQTGELLTEPYDWQSAFFREIAGTYHLAFFAGGGETLNVHEDGTIDGVNQYNSGDKGIELSYFAGRMVVERMPDTSYRLSFADIHYTEEPGRMFYEDGVPFVIVNSGLLMQQDTYYSVFFPHTPLANIPHRYFDGWHLLYTDEAKAAGETVDGEYVIMGHEQELPYVRGTF